MLLKNDPLWYKDAIIYQLHVRSFADSDGDGVGDFQGLTAKLDYLQDLGVTAIWLLPFYPSPLRDDGYDIGDYTDVHPMYGSLEDFQTFLEEAHRRDLRVITELVMNHTSDQHPWFQRARRAPADSTWRNYYVWSDTTHRYQETRIIFKDFEFSNWSWDPLARAYYWHRFYAHQPDLNFDNPDVQAEMLQVGDFWLGMGVDGLRLDAVPYLYEREGTNCENLPQTHAFLKHFRQHVDTHFSSRMLLAEANQWPEDAVAYFGDGDECHMAFHFPLMPRMFVAIRMEDRFPITETLYQTPAIPASSQWALFLRNHDELTLEMVTAEERSFMYRSYAHNPRARINLGIRRRLAPLLQNDRAQIELLNGLLFSLPGTPVIYYGDEIGMGDNIYLGDRNGVRTPMQWSHDRNAGFSRANPQRIFLPVVIDPEYHYEVINVEAQQDNTHSLMHWMRRLIATRKRFLAFSRGSLTFLYPENRKVLAFIRQYEDERVLVIANLSRFIQCVELDLTAFQGMQPVELFGRTIFPRIGKLPYFLTMGPRAFYWFALEQSPAQMKSSGRTSSGHKDVLPTLTVATDWHTLLLRGRARLHLEELLPDFLRQRRWFAGKHRNIQLTEILDTIPIPYESPVGYVTLVQVEYVEGDREWYVVPFTFATGHRAEQLVQELPQIIVARLHIEQTGATGVLYDALRDRTFNLMLLESIGQQRAFRGSAGDITTYTIRSANLLSNVRSGGLTFLQTGQTNQTGVPLVQQSPPIEPDSPFEPRVVTTDQSNTTVIFGAQCVLKVFRRVEPGINPDLEIGRFLTEKVSLARVPQLNGAVEYRQKNTQPWTMAVLWSHASHTNNGWQTTQDALSHYFERVLVHQGSPRMVPVPTGTMVSLTDGPIAPLAQELIGDYLQTAHLLGQRTAELHGALAQEADNPQFAPEPFTDFFQRPFYHAMVGLMDRNFQLLQQQLPQLPDTLQEDARRVVAMEKQIRHYFEPFRDRKFTAMRIRCHGNYHLGQSCGLMMTFSSPTLKANPVVPSKSDGQNAHRCATLPA